MYKSALSCITLLILLTINIYSQDPPIEWEEIPLTDLQMTSFPDDSNATAIILCDYGESRFDDNFELAFTRHLRIKILNANGYDWGTHVIDLYTGKNGERLNDLEGITYSLADNGEILETELDSDDIFEEEVTDERLRYKFTMPGLTPGCILEIRYKIISGSLWLVKDWTFQKNEPVLWSEYRLVYPRNISYAIIKMGYEPWEIDQYNETNERFRGRAASFFGNTASCNSYRWAVKNVRALRDEPYITTIDDYTNTVLIQLAGYYFVSTGPKEIFSDWKTMVSELLDDNRFGGKIDAGDVEDSTISITRNVESPYEKAQNIYNWITNSIVWTGEHRIFADYSPEEVIEYKKGSNAEITFLLLSMLKSAGIDCDPVILSTRSHGKLQQLYPIISQFNYVLARVQIGREVFYLDATDPLRPMKMLPVNVLNVQGFVINPENFQWVTLESSIRNLDQSSVFMSIDESGLLTGKFEEKCGDYNSLYARRECRNKDDMSFIKNFLDTKSSGLIVDSVEITDKDSINLPLRINAGISLSEYSQISGDFIYFNPYIVHRITDNPFKAKDRKFPIDFKYPWGQVIITNIIIPPEYEVKETYTNKVIRLDNSVVFHRLIGVQDNAIQIISRFDINQSIIPSDKYLQLKNFYTEVIAIQSEMLVIGLKADQEELPIKSD